jgi:hypothetical protein
MDTVTTLLDGTKIEFGKGKFDDFCIYVSPPNKKTWFPLDKEYFEILWVLANEYGKNRVYKDVVDIYNLVTKKVDNSVIDKIRAIAERYDADREAVELCLSVFYAAMIAEENKEKSILGKRIKRLGVHQVLFENLSPEEAANQSKGKSWKILDARCRDRGF